MVAATRCRSLLTRSACLGGNRKKHILGVAPEDHLRAVGGAMRNRLMTGAAFVGLLVAAGCAVDSESTSNTTEATTRTVSLATTTAVTTNPTSATMPPSETTSVSSKEPSISLPVKPGSTVEGLVNVGGHAIYARCAGDGSPTIVYFAGWSRDRTKRGVSTAPGIENALGPGFRVCSYERRNTGRGENVDGTQTPEDVIADVDGFLAALDEDGPFLLLGASFGGLVAAAYAVAHPDSVVGVVLRVGQHLAPLAEVAHARLKPTPLAAAGRQAGPFNERWNILVNTDVESDL